MGRSSIVRGKNRNTLLSRDPQWESRMHKSQQKDSDFQRVTQSGVLCVEKDRYFSDHSDNSTGSRWICSGTPSPTSIWARAGGRWRRRGRGTNSNPVSKKQPQDLINKADNIRVVNSTKPLSTVLLLPTTGPCPKNTLGSAKLSPSPSSNSTGPPTRRMPRSQDANR